MSIQGISFWQQDQTYWQQAQAQSQASTADAALINVMGQAETNLAKGLASIANQTALNRVNSEISALVQSALNGSSSTSSSSSGAASSPTSANTSSASSSSPSPATGVGTVPVSTSTALSTLGILPGGTFSISDGTNITKYTSTGTDTVADLINAINAGAAFVTASINGAGKLVITARNHTEIVTVEGSGDDAAALGFGTGNNSFVPKAPAATAAGSSSASSSSSSASASSPTSSKSASSGSSTSKAVTSFAQEMSGSAASFLSASGVSGSLVDMLA